MRKYVVVVTHSIPKTIERKHDHHALLCSPFNLHTNQMSFSLLLNDNLIVRTIVLHPVWPFIQFSGTFFGENTARNRPCPCSLYICTLWLATTSRAFRILMFFLLLLFIVYAERIELKRHRIVTVPYRKTICVYQHWTREANVATWFHSLPDR